MTSQTMATIISLVETAIAEEPAIAAALTNIFTKSAPTPADWQAERDAIMSETYKSLVPHSQLPPADGSGSTSPAQ